MATVNEASGMTVRPSAVRTATNANYVSAITTNSFNKRDVDERLVKRYGDQGITGLLELLGAKKETSNSSFEHYEEVFRHDFVTITPKAGNDFSTGSNSAAKIATVSSDDLLSISSVTNNNHPVRKGNVLLLADNTVVLVTETAGEDGATASSNNEILVIPFDTAGFKTATAAGTAINAAIIGTAFEPGTAQPAGLSPDIIEYSNDVMIIKDSFEVTGSEATNIVYFKVDNEHMGSGYLWYLKGEQDTYDRFLDYAEMMMLLGVQSTSTQGAVSGTSGTEGLLPFIENKGQSMDLGSASITMADFDAIVKGLDKHRGASENALYAGINLALDVDDLLASQTAVSAGGANYGTFNNDKDLAVNLGFQSFTRGGYTFHKKTYDLFNHPKLLGQDNSNFPGYGMVIPMDSRRDARSGEKIPSLRIRYKAVPGYSREMEHWLTGSAVLQNKTETSDVLKSHYRTERGFEGFAANRFLLIKKS